MIVRPFLMLEFCRRGDRYSFIGRSEFDFGGPTSRVNHSGPILEMLLCSRLA